MKAWLIVSGLLAGMAVHGAGYAQPGAIILIDSTGKVAGRLVNETLVLVAVSGVAAAAATIRQIFDAEGRAASGLATWQSGGTVLFTSPDCTTGAHVHSPSHPGVRAGSQVATPSGIVLHVGAIGSATTQSVHSILYDTGCSTVALRQNGLHPVVATVNLTTRFPPPLSLQ